MISSFKKSDFQIVLKNIWSSGLACSHWRWMAGPKQLSCGHGPAQPPCRHHLPGPASLHFCSRNNPQKQLNFCSYQRSSTESSTSFSFLTSPWNLSELPEWQTTASDFPIGATLPKPESEVERDITTLFLFISVLQPTPEIPLLI